jgi:hypothetical protein
MRFVTVTLALAALAATTAIPVAAGLDAQATATPDPPAVETFTAFAVNTNPGPRGRPQTASLTFSIERWSTDQERDMLMTIVREQTDVNRLNDQLLRALEGLPRVGRIRGANTVGWDLKYARQTPMPGGGRQVMLGTDRPLPFWEARNQPRTFDYRFTILDIRLDQENRGEGKMLARTRLIVDPQSNTLVLEQFGLQPVALNQVRRVN